MTDEHEPSTGRSYWPWITVALAVAAVALGVLAAAFYSEGKAPANDSADVGFARDMSVHHAQAVEMANIVYRRTEDPEIERIALDIATAQQFQIGMMTGWLDIWNRTVSSDIPLMSWMGDYDMTLPSPPAGLSDDDSMSTMNHAATSETGSTATPLMPGMAIQSEIDRLGTLPPDQMDILFLQLMIRHHQGGVMMAQAALDKASNKHVLGFAQQVINTQEAEINTMTTMLSNRLASAGAPTATADAAATPTAAAGEMPAMPAMASPAATHAEH